MAGTSEVVAGRISMVSNVVDGPRRARQCSHGSEEDSRYGTGHEVARRDERKGFAHHAGLHVRFFASSSGRDLSDVRGLRAGDDGLRESLGVLCISLAIGCGVRLERLGR